MIHVERRPEPDQFHARVREPGRQALDEHKNPLPSYWTKCLPELLDAYGRICAYSCLYIPGVVGGHSVEHFAPKSKERELAYEWSNYRLVCALMNARKRDFEDVLDPFDIRDDWFELEFVFLQVRPAPNLEASVADAVADTIERLKLNDEQCCTARAVWYEDWKRVPMSDEFMRERSPFVFREAVRQRQTPRDVS